MPCDVTRRVNYNAHVVWDVRLGSKTVTFVLWSNGVGEAIWADGTRRFFDYTIDSDGDLVLPDQMAGNSLSELEPRGLDPPMVGLIEPLSPALQGFLIVEG